MRYTGHAKDRMAERGISQFEVEEALADPIMEWASETDPECRVVTGRTEAGRRLRLVINTTRNAVVTVSEPDDS